MDESTQEPISFGLRLSQLAAAHPVKPAIIVVSPDGTEQVTTWLQLDSDSNRMARLLAERGTTQGSLVAVALPNCPEHFLVCFGSWKLGACVLPLKATLPPREGDQLIEVG